MINDHGMFLIVGDVCDHLGIEVGWVGGRWERKARSIDGLVTLGPHLLEVLNPWGRGHC